MTFKIDTNRGEAVIGPTRVEICAIGNKGYLRIGGEDGPVLRQTTFGERTAAHSNSCHAVKYADFLCATIAHLATVSPGVGERDIIEIIALYLAGAENDAPAFAETAFIVSKATGWSAELIDSHPAAYIDSICMQVPADRAPWRTILLAPSEEESLLSLKHHLAKTILKRGNGPNDSDKNIHFVNREQTLSQPSDSKTNSFIFVKPPDGETASARFDTAEAGLQEQEHAQGLMHKVYLKPGALIKEITQFYDNLYGRISKSDFNFYPEVERTPVKQDKTQTAGSLPDNSLNSSISSVYPGKTAMLHDKHDESVNINKQTPEEDKNSLTPYVVTPFSGSGTSFPSLAISLGEDRAPLISSAKKNIKPHHFAHSNANGKNSEAITSKGDYPKTDVNQISGKEKSMPFSQRNSEYGKKKSDSFFHTGTSLRKLAEAGKKQNIEPVFKLMDAKANKSPAQENMYFADHQSDKRNHVPEYVRNHVTGSSKAASPDDNINLFSSTADQIAVLLHQEADLRGIER